MKRNYTLVLTNQYQDVKSDQHLLTFNTKKPFSKLNFNFETISFQEL